MARYFVCSAGAPGQKYSDENLLRCLTESAYYLHRYCKQKGHVGEISEDDVLILKYDHHFFAYGRVSKAVQDLGNEGWTLKVRFTVGSVEQELERRGYGTHKFRVARMQPSVLLKRAMRWIESRR